MLKRNKHRWSLFLQTIITLIAIWGVVAYRNEAELHRMLDRRERMQTLLGEVLGVVDVGYWEWDLQTDEVVWSLKLYELFDFPEGLPPDYDAWLQALHEEDRQGADTICREAAATGESYTMYYRVQTDSGMRYILETAAVDRGERMIGVCVIYNDFEGVEQHLESSLMIQNLPNP